jgi:hypothetical protein
VLGNLLDVHVAERFKSLKLKYDQIVDLGCGQNYSKLFEDYRRLYGKKMKVALYDNVLSRQDFEDCIGKNKLFTLTEVNLAKDIPDFKNSFVICKWFFCHFECYRVREIIEKLLRNHNRVCLVDNVTLDYTN